MNFTECKIFFPKYRLNRMIDPDFLYGYISHQSVFLPVFGQLCWRWELAAGQLQSHLHAAVPDVVEVLHTSCTVRHYDHSPVYTKPFPNNKQTFVNSINCQYGNTDSPSLVHF